MGGASTIAIFVNKTFVILFHFVYSRFLHIIHTHYHIPPS